MLRLSALFFLFNLSVLAQFAPMEEYVPLTNIYIPEGYDSNDIIEVIVEGYTPTLCHYEPKITVEIKDKLILLKALSQYRAQSDCIKSMVPFQKVIKVAQDLPRGFYTVLIEDFFDLEAKEVKASRFALKIKGSKSVTHDEKIYANIKYIVPKSERSVDLIGYHTSDCFVKDKIKIQKISNTIVILPELRIKKYAKCWPPKMIPFKYSVEIPEEYLSNQKVLIHIRKMSGKSMNYIFDPALFRLSL